MTQHNQNLEITRGRITELESQKERYNKEERKALDRGDETSVKYAEYLQEYTIPRIDVALSHLRLHESKLSMCSVLHDMQLIDPDEQKKLDKIGKILGC